MLRVRVNVSEACTGLESQRAGNPRTQGSNPCPSTQRGAATRLVSCSNAVELVLRPVRSHRDRRPWREVSLPALVAQQKGIV